MKFTLYRILLETPTLIFSADVGASSYNNAIELFYIYLVNEGVTNKYIVLQGALFNGDHIGRHDKEEVLEGTVRVSTTNKIRMTLAEYLEERV